MRGDTICTQVDGLVFDIGRWVQKQVCCGFDNEEWRGVFPLFHAAINQQYLPPYYFQKEDLGKLEIVTGRIIIIYFTTRTTPGIAVVIVITAAISTSDIKYFYVPAAAPASWDLFYLIFTSCLYFYPPPTTILQMRKNEAHRARKRMVFLKLREGFQASYG